MSRYRFRILSVYTVLMVLTLSPAAASAQEFEDIYIVSSPTAGMLLHGGYFFKGSIGPLSSLLFGVNIGFHDRLMFGGSFGIQNFVGRGEIEINDKPGLQLRIRIIEEMVVGPALAIGIDTQGEDAYIESDERYERKSRGVYAVFGKNYDLLGDFSLHGGINYSFENRDEEGINLFGGLIFEVVQGLSLLLDYNAAFDDDDPEIGTSRTRGRGYLDTGVRFDYMDTLRFKILFKDLLGNYINETGVARTVEVYYFRYF